MKRARKTRLTLAGLFCLGLMASANAQQSDKSVRGAEMTAAETVEAQAEWNRINTRAIRLYRQGRYAEATAPAEQALTLARRAFGPEHPDTLMSMNNLASLYADQGRYGEAEPLYVETLAISTRVLGPEHPDTLMSMNNLASLYADQGRYGEAEPLYVETLAIRKRVLGPKHPNTLTTRDNLDKLRADRRR